MMEIKKIIQLMQMELKKKFYLKEEKHFVNKKIKNEKKNVIYIFSVSYYFLLLFYLIILINN